jgi:hypothetical protein
MSQTALCNRYPSLNPQLCRSLLLSLDRLRGDELVMTQEVIANMLDVRREGVTEAALERRRAGLTSYSRGHITALDRNGSNPDRASATPSSRCQAGLRRAAAHEVRHLNRRWQGALANRRRGGGGRH